MRDSGVVDRWMRFELGRLNRSGVERRRSLRALLREPEPSCPTKEGTPHVFERETLERLAAHVPSHQRDQLLLPITIYHDLEVPNECYLSDPVAGALLRGLEGWGEAYRERDGRVWLPQVIARELVRNYPTVFQEVLLPG